MAHVKASIYDSIISQYELDLKRSQLVLGTILDDPLSILTEKSEFDLTKVNKQLLKCIEDKNKLDFMKDNRNYLIEITGSIKSNPNLTPNVNNLDNNVNKMDSNVNEMDNNINIKKEKSITTKITEKNVKKCNIKKETTKNENNGNCCCEKKIVNLTTDEN
jgi:hypothetical protein